MWVLPPDRSRTPEAALEPGRYLLPWYLSDDEVTRYAEILALFLTGADRALDLLDLPWEAAELLSEHTVPGADRAMLVVRVPATAPDDVDATLARVHAALARIACRYAFIYLPWPAPASLGYGWGEKYVKEAVLWALVRSLEEPGHPLSALGIDKAPVVDAAQFTPDPLELVELVEAAVQHRLRHAKDGTSQEGYQRSLLTVAGERLARRLVRIQDREDLEALRAALEIVLSGEPGGDERGRRGTQALVGVGLAYSVGNDVILGPLASAVSERKILPDLLADLPPVAWTQRAKELRAGLLGLPGTSGLLPDSVSAAASGGAFELRHAVESPAALIERLLEALERGGPGVPEKLLVEIVPLIAEVRNVDDAASDLPEPLRGKVVRLLQSLREWTRDFPASGGALQLTEAYLGLLAARGPDQIDRRMRALERIENMGSRGPEVAAVGTALRASGQQLVAMTLARRPRSAEDVDLADRLFQRAIDGLPLSERGLAFLQRGALAESRGDSGLARACYLDAEKDLEGIAPPQLLSAVQTSLAGVAVVTGDRKEALCRCRTALRILRKEPNDALRAAVYRLLGVLASSRGAAPLAAEWLKRARNMAERAGATDQVALCDLGLGTLFLTAAASQGPPELLSSARSFFQDALTLARSLGNATMEMQATTQLGVVAEQEGDLKTASEQYEPALALAVRLNNRPMRLAILELMRGMAERRGAAEEVKRLSAEIDAL